MEPSAGSDIGTKSVFQITIARHGEAQLLRIVVVIAICLLGAYPASARDKSLHHITCEMVRAYVAQMGASQARAVAYAHGMTASQEERAKRCLGG
ncbi:MAG TPA: hypothetical protein VKT24_07660 [Rhizomicrobium sp.]|nr:hypothetical protein [Rhizomicrobium sp.]